MVAAAIGVSDDSIERASNLFDKIRISSFNVISILSGTGYVTDDFGLWGCLLYTSPSPRDRTRSRMPSSA